MQDLHVSHGSLYSIHQLCRLQPALLVDSEWIPLLAVTHRPHVPYADVAVEISMLVDVKPPYIQVVSYVSE